MFCLGVSLSKKVLRWKEICVWSWRGVEKREWNLREFFVPDLESQRVVGGSLEAVGTVRVLGSSLVAVGAVRVLWSSLVAVGTV